MRPHVSLFASFLMLATCAAPVKLPEAPRVTVPAAPAWSVDSAAASLTQRSCPAGTASVAPTDIAVKADPVPFGPADEVAKRLPEGVTFAGGWHLTSDNASFGGLSGLAIDGKAGLLTVSDEGAFVWLGLKDDAPDGAGRIAYMLGADGGQLHGKALADSEGLSVRDGLAIVSFERTNRVSAFALDACGAAAREARIAPLPDTVAGRTIDENRGAEAMTVTPDGIIRFGYETVESGDSPLGAVVGPDDSGWTGETAHNPAGYAFVGLDSIERGGKEETYWLFRSYDPIRGSRNVIRWDDKEIVMTAPMTVDNFEGIAAQPMGNGVTRLWIVSDNNFSDRQRTLLLAFDIAAPSE